ncbi:ankyrin repeat domain-containing protein 50-like [Petromyzon marinus]|uniref:ankyrin repeat domain-containing protein 50-like n=1 Tax=Petromyzon marinus TaxID=7757 RepID=UPI003F705B28
MASSLLQGKAFYCRDWAFQKLQHYLDGRGRGGDGGGDGDAGGGGGGGAVAGALVLGGPGSGKTALCSELVWPTSAAVRQRGLHERVLAYHFCQACSLPASRVSAGRFVRSLVAQLSVAPGPPPPPPPSAAGAASGPPPPAPAPPPLSAASAAVYAAALAAPAARAALRPGQAERDPDEAFRR